MRYLTTARAVPVPKYGQITTQSKPFRAPLLSSSDVPVLSLKGRLHDRAKMARLWTRCGTDKSSLFLCKNCWTRSNFCRIRAIFALSCKRPLNHPLDQKASEAVMIIILIFAHPAKTGLTTCPLQCVKRYEIK